MLITDNQLKLSRYPILDLTPEIQECNDSHIVYIWTDGGSYEDYGSIGVVVVDQGIVTMTFGAFLGRHVSNNIAELEAIIKGLRLVKHLNRPVVIFTDSAYALYSLCDIFAGSKNREVIESIQAYIDIYPHKVSFVKVKGHDGLIYNEIADKIASNLLQSRPQGHTHSTKKSKKKSLKDDTL